MADDEYARKLESLQQYIPFLNNMIVQLRDPRKKNREQQLTKMVSLHSMITDKKKKLKLETLIKCEDVILKLYDKVKSGPHAQGPPLRPPPAPSIAATPAAKFSPITPSSPSPPRDIPKTKPVVIPTEKVTDRDSMLCQPSGSYKTRIDIYSSAADSLKSSPFVPNTNVFERLGKKAPDMSKPPISLEDLEALQDDSDGVDTEKMSLNELTDLRERLQKQLSRSDDNSEQSQNLTINTTVRNTTILTKKAVEKTAPILEIKPKPIAEKAPENKAKTPEIKPVIKTPPHIPPVTKPVKVIKEAASIFGNALSSIDNKLLEDANNKLKEKERRTSIGAKKDSPETGEKAKERRSSKDEKRPESSHKGPKDKTERKNSTDHTHKSKDEKKPNKDKKDEKKPKDDSKKHDKSKSDKDHKEKKKEEEDKCKDSPKAKEDKPKTEPPKPVETTYKRLADKYNPKPRKPPIDASIEVPKNVSESIEHSMKSAPAIPFLDGAQSSPPKPVLPLQPPINVPLLSPTSSTNSIDNEIAMCSKKPAIILPQPVPPPISLLPNPQGQQMPPVIPSHVSNILANPNATAIINTVVNQFKGRQTPVLMPPNHNNFMPNQPNFGNNFPPNEMGGHFNNQGPGNFWGNQPPNYPQRTFTPLPNQFDNQMPPQCYPPGNTTPNPYGHQPPPILSPQYDGFEGRPPPRQDRVIDDGLFGSKDRDMRYRDDWRRPPNQWTPNREPNRDPRLHRDPRGFREDPRPYRREPREHERDARPKFRDPRLNRFSSGNRFERGQTPNRSRSRSMSRESDDAANTFASPLDSLYSNSDGYRRTGKGYGVQNFKIPKIKKEGDAEAEREVKPEAETEHEPETKVPKPETDTATAIEPSAETAEAAKSEENVASTGVSSSTECDNKPSEGEAGKEKETAEVDEISSTNDIQEGESRDDSKITETNQTEIINKFLKKLLENERTRAAASLFIDNVSNSLDDEKLKMVVQTVKSAAVEEEPQGKRKVGRRKVKMVDGVNKKRKFCLRRKRRKHKVKKVVKPVIKDDEEEEEEEEEKEEEKKEVVVSVGERIKSRKRMPVPSTLKKKTRHHKTELDLLHEDIQDMFIRDGVLTATGKRMCRLLKNDAEAKPTPQVETRTRRSKIAAEKFDSKATGNSDKLKVMSNVRVLIPKIPADKLAEVDEEGQRYSLRRAGKPTKSYAEEDSDDDKIKEKDKKEESSDQEKEKEEKEPPEEVEEEKEKLTSPRRIIRKRTKAWASGVIPKRKKKEAAADEEDKPEETEGLDKSMELIEPDKNYYSSKPWHFKSRCKLCPFDGKNITQHYRTKHPESEILSSRLSPTKAEEAIKESTELKLDESEDCKLLSTRKFSFKCRFCDLDMNAKPSNFFDHISTHTGEYRHVCTLCSFGACNAKPLRVHYVKVHAKEKEGKSAWIKSKVYGYICLECNYVQVNKKSVENHVNIYHLGEGKKIMKIYLSSIDYLIDEKPKNQETAAEEPPVLEKEDTEQAAESIEDIRVKKKKLNDNEEPQFKKQKTDEDETVQTEEIEEPQAKKAKLDEDTKIETKNTKMPKEETEKPLHTPIKKEKEIDMTVFTCNTDIQEENEKIEQERLKKMAELNESVKTNRLSLNFVEQLRNRLLQEQKEVPAPEVVLLKSEPMEQEMEPEMATEPEPESVLVPEMITSNPKKPSKVIEPHASSSVEVVQKDNIIIQGMIQKLQGILKEEKTGASDGPPPLTPLVEKHKDDVKTVLSAGFLNIVRDADSLEYACRVPSCLFTSKDRDRFLTHWNEDHSRVNQSYKMTKCRICQSEISTTADRTLLMNFFTHVEDEHLASRRNILRTRRLSGDKLSTSKEEADEKDDFDIKVDENPFPFKISGVMSLAEDPVPPLSPIVENKTPKIESVVLKESKLNNVEKAAVWKCAEAMKKFLQCPRELYKCPQFFCKFATSWRHLFEGHIKAHAALNDELVCCVYCDVKTPLSHAGLHIDLRHSNCLYSCSQCLYRALTREYVMVHVKLKHKESDLIISLPPKTAKTIMMSKQKRFPVKEACQPYRCGYKGCGAEFLYQNEYLVHLEGTHEGIMVCGYKGKQFQCGYKCVVTENMIDHWRNHNCYHYHCLICKTGCMELYTMLEHYSNNHPNLEPIVVDRRNCSPDSSGLGYTDEAFCKIKYVKEDLLDSVNTQQYTIVGAENSASEPKPGSSSAPDKKIIAIIPKSVDVSAKLFTALTSKETPQPQTSQPSFVFASIPDKEKDAEEPQKGDPMRIDDADGRSDVGGDPLSLDGENVGVVTASGDESDSQDVNENADMKSYGLIGYQLYRCAFCDISFSNARDFKTHSMHSKQCRDPKNAPKPFKCVHCERLFKNPHGLLEHIQYHGQLRFCCSLCVKKFPLSSSLRLHMRTKHNVSSTVTTPLVPNKTNLERDEFVLRPVPVAEPEASKEGPNLQNPPTHKKVYGPDEIDQLPTRYIFNSDVKCALCSYSTKVRTNLVRHLQFHSSEKSVPDIAPVNPVPCLDKNEKMFDKMTNLALSSFTGTNSGRMGVKPEPKVENEQVQLPAYVPSNRRYVCCANGCNYLCPEEANLRHHLHALHAQETSFACAHCKATPRAGIEGFLKHLKLHDLHLYKCPHCPFVHNLKHKVDKHCADRHPDKLQKTVTIRALEAELVEAEQPAPVVIEAPPPSNIKWTKPWHCGMCKYRCAAKNDIITHIFNKHDINTQFKCTLCSYKTNEKHTFDDHFKENHPSNDIDIIHVYYKSEGAGQSSTANQKLFDTTPLWQRDRPRVRHIRGILFEETSPQKEAKKKSVGGGRGVAATATATSTSTSNLDLAIEAVAKGIDDISKALEDPLADIDIKPLGEVEGEKAQEESIIIIDDDDEEEGGEASQGEEVEGGDDNDLLIDIEADNAEIKTEPDPDLLSEEMLLKKYGKMCTPVAKAFKCPVCLKFRSKKISYFVYHLLLELKCHRFKCNSCDYAAVTFDAIVTHCQDEHNSVITSNVTDTPVEKTVEYWIQLVIRYQARGIIQGCLPNHGEEAQSAACKSQCEFCLRWFKNIHMLKEHELYHWAEHTYTCGHCAAEHATLNELFQHTFIAHPKYECCVNTNGPYVSRIITNLKSPPSNIAGPQQGGAAGEEVLYACSHCSETEKSVELLQKHHNETHKGELVDFQYKVLTKSKVEVMYCCTYCHEKGADEFLKKHHQDRHVGLKFSIYQHICLECSGTFLNIKDLRSHFSKTHPNKKVTYSCVENKPSGSKDQYSCTKCPFRSCSVGGIRSHLRKHLRPIDCLLCGATFIYPTEARAHHLKEHLHNSESVEENKERLREYEELIQQIVAAKEKPARPSPPRRMLARKSTGAPFVREYSYYGAKREQVDLKSVSTSIEVNNVTTRITVEQFSNIFNIFPVVEVGDCDESKGS